MMQHMRDQLKIEEGKEIGDVSRLISQILKKVQKAKPLSVIANELECEVEDIQSLYDAVMQCGVENSVEEILKFHGNKW